MVDASNWKLSKELEIIWWDANCDTRETRNQYWLRGYDETTIVYESGFRYYTPKDAREHAKDLAKRIENGCKVRKNMTRSQKPHVPPEIEKSEREAIRPIKITYQEQRKNDR